MKKKKSAFKRGKVIKKTVTGGGFGRKPQKNHH